MAVLHGLERGEENGQKKEFMRREEKREVRKAGINSR